MSRYKDTFIANGSLLPCSEVRIAYVSASDVFCIVHTYVKVGCHTAQICQNTWQTQKVGYRCRACRRRTCCIIVDTYLQRCDFECCRVLSAVTWLSMTAMHADHGAFRFKAAEVSMPARSAGRKNSCGL